jgi:hypothetical protein
LVIWSIEEVVCDTTAQETSAIRKQRVANRRIAISAGWVNIHIIQTGCITHRTYSEIQTGLAADNRTEFALVCCSIEKIIRNART